MYLLWKTICDTQSVPSDVSDYVICHFVVPFVKAQRESILIRDLYDKCVTETATGVRYDFMKLLMSHYEELDRFFLTPNITLDRQVPAYIDRFAQLIVCFNKRLQCRITTDDIVDHYRILGLDSIGVFRLLYPDDLAITKAVTRLVTLPQWTNEDIEESRLLMRYCTSKKLDDHILTLVNEAPKKLIMRDPWVFSGVLSTYDKHRLGLW